MGRYPSRDRRLHRSHHQGAALVIHNFPSPGYTAEEDALLRFKVLYRFRYPPDSTEPPEKDG